MKLDLCKTVIKKTLRVPCDGSLACVADDGRVRQLDIALMAVGFKLSGALCTYLAILPPSSFHKISADILSVVRELVGDHVQHNTYFKGFPKNVPDTEEFWMNCIVQALGGPKAARVASQLAAGSVNLLDLPVYGRYQHTYDEMVAQQDKLADSFVDRVNVLQLGDQLEAEVINLYMSLVRSRVPLNDADRALLTEIAGIYAHVDLTYETIPVRENRAIINAARVRGGFLPYVETVTDVLRLACMLSDGDVTLEKKTKFKSFSKSVRGLILAGLNNVMMGKSGQEQFEFAVSEGRQHAEEFKRLRERLHPGDFTCYIAARHFFAALSVHGFKTHTVAGKVDLALAEKDLLSALKVAENVPGFYFRSLDRFLRAADSEVLRRAVTNSAQNIAGSVSGRVLLSLREHLVNRVNQKPDMKRIFSNKKGTAWVTDDKRVALNAESTARLVNAIDAEIGGRIIKPKFLVYDPAVSGVALPISEKNQADGFRIMPRGSDAVLKGNVLRFFTHWREVAERTDYDLSALYLDRNYVSAGQASWTSLRGGAFMHSGDITESRHGASEFIDTQLDKISAYCIVPQVNIFAGEDFKKVGEAFFGYMERDAVEETLRRDGGLSRREVRGLPFEARTVRMKSDLRGEGRVALPMVFYNDNGEWHAKWMHLYLKGAPNCNRIEKNKMNTSLLVRSIVEREYLTVGYLIGLMGPVTMVQKVSNNDNEPVTYIGLDVPENLPEGSKSYTLTNLKELIPA